GGQTHATFDSALPDGREFDNTMQRSIYYNFFDGFTSRAFIGTERTVQYLKRLGVNEFINLITCSDNYNPANYPNPKSAEAHEFIPTWMFATPTFGGLRLSLSDDSRLHYGIGKPNNWKNSIEEIKLNNDKINIDITLTPGLNVIIGESSSGKTLLVDSLYRRLTGVEFGESKYLEFGVDLINIKYPDDLDPHFIRQNFVSSVTNDDKKINDIEIIEKILPENKSARRKIEKGLNDLSEHFRELLDFVDNIEKLEAEINRIPTLQTLIVLEHVDENMLNAFLSQISLIKNVEYSSEEYEIDVEFLSSLDDKLTKNPFVDHNADLIQQLKAELEEAKQYSVLEKKARQIVSNEKKKIDQALTEKKGEAQRKKQDFEGLVIKMKKYYDQLLKFDEILNKIAEYSIEAHSQKINIEDYELSIENKFEMNKDIVVSELNKLLLKDNSISSFDDITPNQLFKRNFKGNIKGVQKGSGSTYKTIKENLHSSFVENDKINYKIFTPDGKDFDQLSPGLKTAIILDLILNYEEDRAPLIIDQPEDNLATSYMNDGLVKSIKRMKNKKQIIFVSHNATIPMAGDAQNIILCENNDGKIEIKSSPLEGQINGIDVVDHIAKIADGGKSSIKKRFKKYNLKKFKED
ncbi:ATPase, partial [Candidatus Woesearchaeota archaeon]|nr:ATPase [Candidatus Woesearchaeota archaeon]